MIQTLTTHFSSAHFYNQKKWSPEKNLQEFGLCYTPFGHGHNYELQVLFHCQHHNADQVRERIQNLIVKVDHQHLNFTLPEFKDVIPTTENIALYLWKNLKQNLTSDLVSLKLFETSDLWVEIINE